MAGNNLYGYDSSSDDTDDDDGVKKQNQLQDNKLWDSFQDPPVKNESGSSTESQERIDKFFRILKLIVAIVVLIVILGTSVLSKMSLLFMTSHVKKNIEVPFCDINQPEKDMRAIIPTEQRIAWIWAIIFAYAAPEAFTLIRAARIFFFKNIPRPHFSIQLLLLIFESFHAAGMALLMIVVLPNLDVIQGVMLTNCVLFIPSVLGFLSRADDEPKLTIKYALDILSICGQVTGFIVWPLFNNKPELWYIPVAVFLTSFHWWENYISEKSRFDFMVSLAKVKNILRESRYYNQLYLSTWKMFLFAGLAIYLSGESFYEFFDDFLLGWGNHTVPIREIEPILSDVPSFPDLSSVTADTTITMIESDPWAIFWALMIHMMASYFCYTFSKFACKIQIQTFSFAFSVNLTVPISVSILLIFCGLRATNTCHFHSFIPDYLFFNPPPVYNLDQYVVNDFAWISVIWILSQIWVTRHIWLPKSDKNASSDRLFVTPFYNSLLIDQSLAMNRQREDQEEVLKKKDLVTKVHDGSHQNENVIDRIAHLDSAVDDVQPFDRVPKVFICATMWHENKEEMMEFLKSILRLDNDQCARRMAMKYIQNESDDIDSEYYDLETHIFFDDAFIIDKKKYGDDPNATAPLNSYVKLLINSIEDAAREVHKTSMKIFQPARIVTPYGGRLEWTLPGRTKIIAHLKHASKIRKKKRWSQVMYMYYLLGYKIMQLDASDRRKLVIAQNTFLLALDGDIDFQPQAVHLLISRMKIDEFLGAACGRIHPIGDGPMVWYQKFEYAIGHWLQKATEHVIGCVLCSPGCFSLFRGRALMENSVMKKYTTNSEQARHYVQYDQGEDRWLCTLLLKQKFRVEYSAASDAYTHAPEGFNEFYNQRRRWVPSTMANILDLLMDAKHIVKTNDSISMPYIIYQAMLMIGTILGPGTIFLMMVGSLVAVFGIGLWVSFLWNFIPLIVFMIVCYTCKSKIQLLTAFFITAIYALVMMAVLIGIFIQLQEDGLMSPTSLFFLAVALQIVVTGILHPQEMGCLICGIIYYITIPSMYLLLVVYSIFNMNDVSWGTRENKAPPPAPGAVPAEKQSQIQKMFGFLKPNADEEGSIDISFAGIFRCMFCTHPKGAAEQAHLLHITEQLAELNSKLRSLEVKLSGGMSDAPIYDRERQSMSPEPEPKTSIEVEQERPDELESVQPDWFYDPDIRNGDRKTLSSSEELFWIELIEKYLKPEVKTDEEKEEIRTILATLRDVCVFAFVMMNALFALVIMLLQINKSMIHIQWPFGATNFIAYDEGTMEITIRREYMQLEPIGLLFVLFFGLILFVQFVAMLIHRFGTISQILAATEINWYFGKRTKDMSAEAELRGTAVELAKFWQRPKAQWDENDLDVDQQAIARRRDTIKMIMNQHENRDDWSNLEANFKRRFLKSDELDTGRFTIKRRATQNLLDQRRHTINEKRKSLAEQRRLTRKSMISNTYGTIPGVESRKETNISEAPIYSPDSGINQLENFNFPRSYENRAFEIEDMEMTETGAKMPPRSSIAFARHRPSARPNNRPSQVKFSSDVDV